MLDWGRARSIPNTCLVASELVTNAMVHARTHLTVTLSSTDGRLRIAVRDASGDPPRPQSPRPGGTGGRGLQIVDNLDPRLGLVPHPGRGEGGLGRHRLADEQLDPAGGLSGEP